ncbi:MAG TPA: proton-conducting transporter membrane subunit [Candidatus Bathyarchaeia archaeon]|nr:proton-conducting transporter membrane subunit [Candidatus Bathyarchaeia archaeon]
MPVFLIIIPLAAVVVLNLPFHALLKRAAFWVGVLACLFQAGLVVSAPDYLRAGCAGYASRLLQFIPTVDNLALVMLLAIAVVAFSALMVARYSIRDTEKLFNFSNLVVLALAGMNGVVLANDLFSLYVFLEVTAVASFILIAFNGDRDAFEGTFKYLILSAAATVMILSAVAFLFIVTGSVSFANLQAIMLAGGRDPLVLAALILLSAGLFIKGGLVPFHGWLPDAYSAAPPATSVLLAGIVTKTTGVYTLIRLVTSVFAASAAVNALLLVVGILSILVGALAALGQSDFKRMLAYSSISQVGYIVLGLGAGTPLGIAGAVFHLFNHSVFKSLLFVNSAAVEQQSGTRNMDKLGGISDRMPVTGTTSVIAFLSTAGIPPLSGFWSKLIIVIAVWNSGHHAYAAVAILASLITLAYFLSMQRRVFFGQLAQGLEGLREAGPWVLITVTVLALITIGIGLFMPWIFETFLLPIRSIL